MSLMTKEKAEPKTVQIAGFDFYEMAVAASLLNVSRSTLCVGLQNGCFNFKHGKLPDSPKVYVLASDVNTYRRSRDLAFAKQLGLEIKE